MLLLDLPPFYSSCASPVRLSETTIGSWLAETTQSSFMRKQTCFILLINGGQKGSVLVITWICVDCIFKKKKWIVFYIEIIITPPKNISMLICESILQSVAATSNVCRIILLLIERLWWIDLRLCSTLYNLHTFHCCDCRMYFQGGTAFTDFFIIFVKWDFWEHPVCEIPSLFQIRLIETTSYSLFTHAVQLSQSRF